MHHDLRVFDDVDSLAHAGAAYVAELAHRVASRPESFAIAFSGGTNPWLMIDDLAPVVAWDHTRVYQVDERVVDEDSDLRNLKHLRACLSSTTASINVMDVNDHDLDDACRRYASSLPDVFDLIHLGLGPDGHCASLVPNDPVLEVNDRLVAISGPYQNALRMTLTYPALARATQLLWLVSGEDKREALAKLLEGDTSIPAGRVEAGASLIMTERSAMPS